MLVACAIALPPAWGATYKWTDEQGRVHYGDSIPPGEIHRPHEKMDRQGLVDMKVDAAPDPAQRAEEHRRAPQLAVEQEETRRRAIHDQFLIETYRDTTQARTAYDAKLARLDTSITLATAVMEKLTARRTALGKSAAAREYDDGTTHKLQQEIGELDLQLTQQRKYIEARRMERVELEQTAAQDIARIEQLQAEQLEAARDQLP